MAAIAAARVTLDGGQRDPHLGGPPLRRRERVGARVHHGHPVPERRERHGEAAGPAADVHDVQLCPGAPAERRRPGGDHALEHVPDQR
jgi:hypothetical protein